MRQQATRMLAAVLALFTFTAALIACKQTPATERAEEQARQAGEDATKALEKAGQQVERSAQEAAQRAEPLVEDAAVTARVKAKLAADPEVAAYKIDVDTVNHVVTLNGSVDSAAESAEAEKLTRGTEGVTQVVNRLTVGAAPPAGASPAPSPRY